jgi:putative transposase
MPQYVRLYEPGATYFFTVLTHKRRPFLTSALGRRCLRAAWKEIGQELPFETLAVCLLQDHLHCLWALPEEDDDFSTRWRKLKTRFTRLFLTGGGIEGPRNASRKARGERGVWQRRGWEHKIRDMDDYVNHFDYIHFNPVMHGHVNYPEDWPWSTFHRYARMGWYDADWGKSRPKGLDGMDRE